MASVKLVRVKVHANDFIGLTSCCQQAKVKSGSLGQSGSLIVACYRCQVISQRMFSDQFRYCATGFHGRAQRSLSYRLSLTRRAGGAQAVHVRRILERFSLETPILHALSIIFSRNSTSMFSRTCCGRLIFWSANAHLVFFYIIMLSAHRSRTIISSLTAHFR